MTGYAANAALPMADLKEILDRHLPYEIGMLLETFVRLERGVADEVIRNALIESFCIHARSLIDFFRHKQGVSASDFCDAGHAPLDPPDDLVKKLNNQIAHLTLKRTSLDEEKIGSEDRRKLRALIGDELGRFIQHLKPEYAAWSPRSSTEARATKEPLIMTTTSTPPTFITTDPWPPRKV